MNLRYARALLFCVLLQLCSLRCALLSFNSRSYFISQELTLPCSSPVPSPRVWVCECSFCFFNACHARVCPSLSDINKTLDERACAAIHICVALPARALRAL